MNGAFGAQVRSAGEVHILDLAGQLDGGAGDALLQAYETVPPTVQTIVLNFGGIDYINSSGIAAIVNLLAKAHRGQKRIVAFGVSEHFTEIFTITRVADLMPLYENEAKALGHKDEGGDAGG